MVDMRYGAAELEDSAIDHDAVAARADEIVTLLAVPVGPEVYGSSEMAMAFTVALERARLGSGTRVMREIGVRAQTAARVRATAALGRQLGLDTAAMAAGATPGSPPPLSTPGAILQGMMGPP